MDLSVYWINNVTVINTKEYPLGRAIYFDNTAGKFTMYPANAINQTINKGDKVNIQISFNRILRIEKIK